LDVQRRDPERSLTKDEMLDDNDNNFNAVEQKTADIKVPVG